MQLGHIHPGESLAYLKVLENLTIVVDHEQIEKTTAGNWRDDIADIVSSIVQIHGALLFTISR